MSVLTGAFRVAAVSTGVRATMMKRAAMPVAMQVRNYSDHSETFEEFNDRYLKFFESVEDQFEAQRGLNNAFAQDLVPSPEVIEAALRAARRVNDFPLAVRVFEGIKHKVMNENQYKQYLEVLKPVREELGITLKEELYSA
ncbi:cytochrome-c oxidase chain vi precursor [Malassezia pachydermatis]|uniref:Cytochrome c oxidase subunit 6, mitochondrial n=1 Tax=Malassezia pachydermatis TaxID=77020 RepID=A0A0M8MNL2_9BASI|nr:cytochrome-c oxidase chain vi precursor [Malassezia pachydermatis]KOS16116.1 cytochrome-c oxidase chain vi precursor [Malassezia pachydermatis]